MINFFKYTDEATVEVATITADSTSDEATVEVIATTTDSTSSSGKHTNRFLRNGYIS